MNNTNTQGMPHWQQTDDINLEPNIRLLIDAICCLFFVFVMFLCVLLLLFLFCFCF